MEILNKIEPRLKNGNNTEQSIIQRPYSAVNKNNPKKEEIVLKFDSAWKADNHFSKKEDFVFVRNLFKTITIELVKLKAQNIVVEITPDDSVLIKSDLLEKRLYIELFLMDEEPHHYDVVINLYENQKHVFGTAGLIKTTFAKFHKFLA